MNKKENEILLAFLKYGFSTRQLDRKFGNNSSRGWVSWDILKKYQLQNSDKGKLFVYSSNQSHKIINSLEKKKGFIDELIKSHPPNNLQKYRNTYVIADSEENFYNVMSGETRNIIQGFFNSRRKLIEKCQFQGCTETKQIDTVHFNKNRIDIFIECASSNKESYGKDFLKFDVYKTMFCFLKSHSMPKSICFLCKNHHKELHRIENKENKKELANFKRKIIF